MSDIREGRSNDYDAVMQLWRESQMEGVNREQWRAITSGGCAQLLVAESGEGAIVGAAIAAYDGWRAFVYHIAVAKAHRRTGIATALISGAENNIKQRGAERIFVLVHESKTDGLALCAAAGYEPEGDIALVKSLSG